MRNCRIVTISREFGSGGRFIGEQAAKALGIPFYDKEIIEKVMQETGFAKETIEGIGEYAPSKSSWAYAFVGRGQDGFSVIDTIYSAQHGIIDKLAKKSACVIVGRNADAVLSDRDDCLHVFIQGNMDDKIERICRLYDKTPNEAHKLIKDTDKKRAVNYQYCTGRKWGARENYDLVLNSSSLGYDTCIDFIIKSVTQKNKV